MFDSRYAHKDQIDDAYGGELSWERLEGKRGCRIVQRQTSGGYRDDERMWPGIQDETIDSMIRLEHALHHFISKLPV